MQNDAEVFLMAASRGHSEQSITAEGCQCLDDKERAHAVDSALTIFWISASFSSNPPPSLGLPPDELSDAPVQFPSDIAAPVHASDLTKCLAY